MSHLPLPRTFLPCRDRPLCAFLTCPVLALGACLPGSLLALGTLTRRLLPRSGSFQIPRGLLLRALGVPLPRLGCIEHLGYQVEVVTVLDLRSALGYAFQRRRLRPVVVTALEADVSPVGRVCLTSALPAPLRGCAAPPPPPSPARGERYRGPQRSNSETEPKAHVPPWSLVSRSWTFCPVVWMAWLGTPGGGPLPVPARHREGKGHAETGSRDRCGDISGRVRRWLTQGARLDCRPDDPARVGCGGGEQIALTNAAGTILARRQVTFTKSGSWCALPFSFSGVPSLAGYGIRVVGLGGGTVWLTPAQTGQFVKLRIGAGFALSDRDELPPAGSTARPAGRGVSDRLKMLQTATCR
jgi:hypothetical protein